MPKMKSLRITDDLHDLISGLAEVNGYTIQSMMQLCATVGADAVVSRGIVSPAGKMPAATADDLVAKAEQAAARGGEALAEFLRSIGSSAENSLKYDIKRLKQIAADADVSESLRQLPSLIIAGDSTCLDGRAAFDAWWDGIDKPLQKALAEHYQGWRYDAGRSDSHMQMFNERPAKRHWNEYLKQQEK